MIFAVSMHFPSVRRLPTTTGPGLILDSLQREVAFRSFRPSERTRIQSNDVEDPLRTSDP